MEVEQLSFFSLPAQPAVAVCCMDGRSFPAEPAEGWMPLPEKPKKEGVA